MTSTQFQHVWEALDSSGAPLLWEWRQESAKHKPYQGLKIYHNIPLTLETICKIEALCVAGADVVVSRTIFIAPATEPQARKAIDEMGLEYREEKWAEPGEFDVYLDCCAELSHLCPPNIGVVELTRTGAIAYEKKKFAAPVLSVDNSYLKAIETFYGTGESFGRAFQMLSGQEIQGKIFAIVGYGKVGRGVAHGIQKLGGNCLIFDVDPAAKARAMSLGLQAFPCGDHEEALKALSQADVVVTATGRPDSLKKAFSDAEDRLAGKILCNMGADDEIGQGFKNSTILAGGGCLNFTLQHPTLMRYLDPSFYAHNMGVQLLREGRFAHGFHPFPKELDLSIVHRWSEIHGEPIDQVIELEPKDQDISML